MADTQHAPSHEPEKRSTMFANIIAIIGFVLLTIIVVWGLFNLASFISPWFSSLFGGDEKAIQVTAPASATSGDPVAIRWQYDTDTAGVYAFLYQCVDGISFAVPMPDESFSPIPCGNAFATGSATTSFTILPLSAATSSMNVSVSVLFIPSAPGTTEPEATGSASIRIEPSTTGPQETGEPSEPDPSTPKPVTPPRPVGPSDLSVTILSVMPEPGGVVAVSFDIANVGTGPSGAYYFNAQLPTTQPYTYVSPAQSSLAPGDHVVNTLRFTQPTPGTFTVTVDPANLVQESNEANNSASRAI